MRVPARREGGGCPPVDFTFCLVSSPAFLDIFYLFSATGNKQVMPEPGEAEGTGGLRDAPHFLLLLFSPISLPGSFLATRNEEEKRNKSSRRAVGKASREAALRC